MMRIASLGGCTELNEFRCAAFMRAAERAAQEMINSRDSGEETKEASMVLLALLTKAANLGVGLEDMMLLEGAFDAYENHVRLSNIGSCGLWMEMINDLHGKCGRSMSDSLLRVTAKLNLVAG